MVVACELTVHSTSLEPSAVDTFREETGTAIRETGYCESQEQAGFTKHVKLSGYSCGFSTLCTLYSQRGYSQKRAAPLVKAVHIPVR